MKHSILGVIGGLGPETGCKFSLNVNKRIKLLTKRQPHILLDNLPITVEAEEHLINGKPSKEDLHLLIESVQRLNRLDVTMIVIPCNTVHIFIDKLRAISNIPILSIIEETAKKCEELRLKKVGLLASQTTINHDLFGELFEKKRISLFIPDNKNQKLINELILKILNETVQNNDKEQLKLIIQELKKEGAEAIILGCTDLQLLINNNDIKNDITIPLIDTCKVLEDAAIKRLIDE